jgi:hypothetical protein
VSTRQWARQRQRPLAWAALAAAMALAAALLLWEGRGLTFLVDEWWFGFAGATKLDASSLLTPDNGHLAVVPIPLTKASLELFGAGTTPPLRLVGILAHLGTALFLFLLLRRRIGEADALVPTVLVLFFGASSDLLIGSHGLPMTIAVSTGLGAPAFSLAGLEGTDVASREAADRLLGRLLPVAVVPAAGPPQGLPAGLEANQEGWAAVAAGALPQLRAARRERPPAGPGAAIRALVRPRAAPLVPITARRFGDGFSVAPAPRRGARLPPLESDRPRIPRLGANLAPQEQILVCAA